MKKQIQKPLIWISVHDKLPPTNQSVLAMNDKGSITDLSFNPETGWSSKCWGNISFWALYNLPK